MNICIYGEESVFLKWRAIIRDNYGKEIGCNWCQSLISLKDCLTKMDTIGIIFQLESCLETSVPIPSKIDELNQITRFIRQVKMDVEVAVLSPTSDKSMIDQIALSGYRIKNNQDSVGIQELLRLLDRAIGRRTGGCHTESSERLARLEVQIDLALAELNSTKEKIEALQETLYGNGDSTGWDTQLALAIDKTNEVQRKLPILEEEIADKVLNRIYQELLLVIWVWCKSHWLILFSGLSGITAVVAALLKALR